MPSDADADLDAMLTPAQAARAVNVSRQLVHDWIKRGRLEADEHGLVVYGHVLDLEMSTRNCARPGTFPRKPRPVPA